MSKSDILKWGVRGLIVLATNAIGCVVASCIQSRDENAIEAGSGEMEAEATIEDSEPEEKEETEAVE